MGALVVHRFLRLPVPALWLDSDDANRHDAFSDIPESERDQFYRRASGNIAIRAGEGGAYRCQCNSVKPMARTATMARVRAAIRRITDLRDGTLRDRDPTASIGKRRRTRSDAPGEGGLYEAPRLAELDGRDGRVQRKKWPIG